MPEPTAAPETRPHEPLLPIDPPPPCGGEILTYDEINRRYLDECMVTRVTARDEDGWPCAGYVIAHSLSDKECTEQFLQALAAGEPREASHHFFVAAPLLRTGAEVRAAMEQLEAEWPAVEERRCRHYE